MKVRNVSGVDREIAATGQLVEADGTVEVDDDLGASLCEQAVNWEAVKAPAPSKRKEGDD